MSYTKVIYFHGGPGFSGVVEEAILKPGLEVLGLDSFYWNEPHFQKLEQVKLSVVLRSVEEVIRAESRNEKVHLIFHSFSCFYLSRLKNPLPSNIVEVTLIAPVFDLNRAHRNIVNLSIVDFQSISDEEKVKVLKELIKHNKKLFDEPMQECLDLCLANTKLMSHYWYNSSRFSWFLEQASLSEFKFNLTNFKGLLHELSKLEALFSPIAIAKNREIKKQVIFGVHDPICKFDEQEQSTAQVFGGFKRVDFKNSGHWPHLEELEVFLKFLQEGKG